MLGLLWTVKLTPLFTGSLTRCLTLKTTKHVQPDNLLAVQDLHVRFLSLCSLQFVCLVTMTSTRKALSLPSPSTLQRFPLLSLSLFPLIYCPSPVPQGL